MARAPPPWKSKLIANDVTVVVGTINEVLFVDAATLCIIDRFVTGKLQYEFARFTSGDAASYEHKLKELISDNVYAYDAAIATTNAFVAPASPETTLWSNRVVQTSQAQLKVVHGRRRGDHRVIHPTRGEEGQNKHMVVLSSQAHHSRGLRSSRRAKKKTNCMHQSFAARTARSLCVPNRRAARIGADPPADAPPPTANGRTTEHFIAAFIHTFIS